MSESFIIGAQRSAIGRFIGSMATLSAVDMGTQVAAGLLRTCNVDPQLITEVFIGQVVQAGCGQNPARQVALSAGLSDTVCAVTVNQVCGSGLRAVMSADRAIRAGDCDVILTGGMESMTHCPHFLRGTRSGVTKFGDATLVDSMLHDGLVCAFDKCLMGDTAEYLADKQKITRREQDEFSVNSHLKAARAVEAGAFKKEITPIEIPGRKGPTIFETDECIRADASLESIGRLPTVFKKNAGTVTAGNASALADGAAMVLVASGKAVKRHGWTPRARIVSASVSGGPPRDLFTTPIEAVRIALDKAGLKTGDIDLFEINEAFAVEMLACIRGLEIDAEQVNVNGGSIGLGHPIGASGSRIVVTLLHALEARNLKRGVATLCLGGGNAVAMVIERV
jgi:acetyl-CoA C-acetyltransferase